MEVANFNLAYLCEENQVSHLKGAGEKRQTVQYVPISLFMSGLFLRFSKQFRSFSCLFFRWWILGNRNLVNQYKLVGSASNRFFSLTIQSRY